MVIAASRMVSAISLGVFRRFAPSTMLIIRSRKVSPGLAVTRTMSQSERTRVPPVTALRSPPLSRMTGALSPVTALSSTEAIPSTTSPSAGIELPGADQHDVALAKVGGRNLGPRRIRLRPGQAVRDEVLPRPAQRLRLGATPPLGHRLGEVGEEHREPEPEGDRQDEARGFLAPAGPGLDQQRRGQHRPDPDHEHDRVAHLPAGIEPAGRSRRTARRRIRPSSRCDVFDCRSIVPLPPPYRGPGFRASTTGPRASAGKKVSAPTTSTIADQQERRRSARGSGASPPRPGSSSWRPATRPRARVGMISQKRAEEHDDAEGDVVEGAGGVQPGEGAAVVVSGRGEGVEDLAEAVGAGVEDALAPGRAGPPPAPSRRGPAAAGSGSRATPSSSRRPRSSCPGTPGSAPPSARPRRPRRSRRRASRRARSRRRRRRPRRAASAPWGPARPAACSESCMALTEPLEAAVVAVAQSAELAMPKRVSFPSMFPPACSGPAGVSSPSPARTGVPACSWPHGQDQERDQQDHHGRQKRPALPRVSDHPPEREAERRREQQDRQHLEEVGQAAWGSRTGGRSWR